MATLLYIFYIQTRGSAVGTSLWRSLFSRPAGTRGQAAEHIYITRYIRWHAGQTTEHIYVYTHLHIYTCVCPGGDIEDILAAAEAEASLATGSGEGGEGGGARLIEHRCVHPLAPPVAASGTSALTPLTASPFHCCSPHHLRSQPAASTVAAPTPTVAACSIYGCSPDAYRCSLHYLPLQVACAPT